MWLWWRLKRRWWWQSLPIQRTAPSAYFATLCTVLCIALSNSSFSFWSLMQVSNSKLHNSAHGDLFSALYDSHRKLFSACECSEIPRHHSCFFIVWNVLLSFCYFSKCPLNQSCQPSGAILCAAWTTYCTCLKYLYFIHTSDGQIFKHNPIRHGL